MLLVLALTVANYGYPLAQFLFLDRHRRSRLSGASAMTNGDRPASPDSRFAVWIGATVALFVVAVLVGFVWLPSAQRGADGLDLWSAICRAVGLPSGERAGFRARSRRSRLRRWPGRPRRDERLAQGNAARGAALATTCNNCHGANGISADAAFPNLAGQSVAAIYKQLEDFKSGKRNPAVMGVFVAPLSQQEMLDLAAHFASLPNPFAAAAARPDPADTAARRLIEVGEPAARHRVVRGLSRTARRDAGAPGLRGQQRAYLEQQLQAFKAGNRRNDISEQMRSVARQLTGDEIAMLAAYYSSFAQCNFSIGEHHARLRTRLLGLRDLRHGRPGRLARAC